MPASEDFLLGIDRVEGDLTEYLKQDNQKMLLSRDLINGPRGSRTSKQIESSKQSTNENAEQDTKSREQDEKNH